MCGTLMSKERSKVGCEVGEILKAVFEKRSIPGKYPYIYETALHTPCIHLAYFLSRFVQHNGLFGLITFACTAPLSFLLLYFLKPRERAAVAGDGFEEHLLRPNPKRPFPVQGLIDNHALLRLGIVRGTNISVQPALEMPEIASPFCLLQGLGKGQLGTLVFHNAP